MAVRMGLLNLICTVHDANYLNGEEKEKVDSQLVELCLNDEFY